MITVRGSLFSPDLHLGRGVGGWGKIGRMPISLMASDVIGGMRKRTKNRSRYEVFERGRKMGQQEERVSQKTREPIAKTRKCVRGWQGW